MTRENQTMEDTSTRELVISRTLNAPRELVFDAWTDPKHLINWWGPSGFTNTFLETDIRTGGAWRFIMHGPDGVDYPNKIYYHEITRPERIVYTHSDDGLEAQEAFKTTVTFEDLGNKTGLVMKVLFASAEELAMVIKEHHAIEGGNQTIDKLEEYLAKI